MTHNSQETTKRQTKRTSRKGGMVTIDGNVLERELIEWGAQRVLTSVHVVGQAGGGYQLIVTTSWKQGNYVLVNTRSETPRQFVSIDRLLKFLERCGVITEFILLIPARAARRRGNG